MKTTEQKAIEIVMRYERKQGRKPVDVSTKGLGYDISSSGRYIEVKGKAQGDGIPQWITLYKKVISKLGRKIMKYYIYIVYDLPSKKRRKTKPKLMILPSHLVLSNLEIDVNYILFPKRIVKDKRSKIDIIKLRK